MKLNLDILQEKLINYKIVDDNGDRFVSSLLHYLRLSSRTYDPVDVVKEGDKEIWKELIIRAIHIVGNRSINGESYKVDGDYDKLKNELYKYLESCLVPPKQKYYLS